MAVSLTPWRTESASCKVQVKYHCVLLAYVSTAQFAFRSECARLLCNCATVICGNFLLICSRQFFVDLVLQPTTYYNIATYGISGIPEKLDTSRKNTSDASVEVKFCNLSRFAILRRLN